MKWKFVEGRFFPANLSLSLSFKSRERERERDVETFEASDTVEIPFFPSSS